MLLQDILELFSKGHSFLIQDPKQKTRTPLQEGEGLEERQIDRGWM